MVEWFKAAVLKTAVGKLTEGSNPSFSAIFLSKKWRTKTQVFTPMRDYLSSFICEKIVKKLIISER